MAVLKQSGWKLEKDCFLANLVFSGKWLYLVKVVVFGLKRFYSGKNNCIWAKVVVFVQKRMYSRKVVVLGQKWLCLCKRGCIRAKCLY